MRTSIWYANYVAECPGVNRLSGFFISPERLNSDIPLLYVPTLAQVDGQEGEMPGV